MVDPEIYDDENVLIRTPGISVKSIPFEGILTTKRIILVDRAKGHLPPKEIILSTITSVESGENAIRDQILTLSVTARTGDVRQMILTFSQRGGGSRSKERDAWEKTILENIPAAPVSPGRRVITATTPPVAAPSRISIVKATPQQGAEPDSPAPVRQPLYPSSDLQPGYDSSAPVQNFFCTRCGNKVPLDSAFCNRCGSPVVPPRGMTASPSSMVSIEQPRYTADRQVPPAVPPGRLALNIPDDPVPKTGPDRAVRQPPEWEEEELQQPVQPLKPARQPKPAGKQKKPGLLSGLLLSRKNKMPPAPKTPRRSRGFVPSRKLLLGVGAVIAILVVLAAGALFVYPLLTSGALSLGPGTSTNVTATPTPTSTSSGSSTTVLDSSESFVPIEIKTAEIPATGVQVHVNYLGGFTGVYGMQDSPVTVPGNSGDRVWEIEDAKGHVIAEFTKDDGSSHDLLVEIYKDGVLLTSDSTTNAYGSVRLSADIAA